MVSRKKAKGKARKAAKEATKQVVKSSVAEDDSHHQHQESLEEQMQRLKLISNKNLFTIKQNEYGNQSAYAAEFIPKHTLIFAEVPAIRGG